MTNHLQQRAFPTAGGGYGNPRLPSTEDFKAAVLRACADPRTTVAQFISLSEVARALGQTQTAQALLARAAQKDRQPAPSPPPVLPPVAAPISQGTVDESLAVPVYPAPRRRPTQPNLPVAGDDEDEEVESLPMVERRPDPPPPVIPGVPLERWAAFEKHMARGKLADITPAGRYGAFSMSPKRLQDLGLVTSAKKMLPAEARQLLEAARGEQDPQKAEELRAKAREIASKGSRWETVWASPDLEAKFLASPDLQKKAFRKSMKEYAKSAVALYRSAFGKKVNGKIVTLSGLLAVANMAGAPGLDSWLKDKSVRERFPSTTKAFEEATGIF